MTSDLSGFVAEKRGKGFPWAHIAAMAGRPLDSLRPYMALEDAYRLHSAEATPVPDEIVIPEPMMRRLAGEVCAEHDVRLAAVIGPKRDKRLNLARQHVMWRLSLEPGVSLQMIGRFLGNRNHATVIHGIRAHMLRTVKVAA